jgi:hypothetical protein
MTSMPKLLRRVLCVLGMCCHAAPGDAMQTGAVNLASIRVATRSEIVEAMLAEKAKNYNLLATANGARFSAGVILHVARRARGVEGSRVPVLLDHRDYFEAFLQITGLSRDAAPTFLRIADQYGEDQFIDPCRECVIEKIIAGPTPELAVNVVAGWPDGAGVASEYTYTDASSTPPLRVIHKRVNSYRLLDFGDMLLYDDIEGIYGRATGGLLGLMFTLIGDGKAVRSFIAYASDGIQVTRTTAKKAITVTQTATVTLDGRGERGVPPGRADLNAIEKRLKRKFEARYHPLRVDPADWTRARRAAR